MMDAIQNAVTHAEREYPKESCGIVIVFKGRERYVPCRNSADDPHNFFVLHQEDYADAEDKGEIVKIVHSHPKSPPKPSQADLVNIEQGSLPWVIVNPQTKQYTETKPTGYITPLIGRNYSYGTLDCFAILRDYYGQKLNIFLPDKAREGRWWEAGKNLFLDFYEEYGFKQVKELQKHDVILMYNGSNVPNHFGIYLGDGNMLHHAQGRLSSKDVYGNAGFWYKNTWGYLRHVDLT